MNEVEKHNRAVMLNRVRTYWLKGVLEESLHGGELIDLSLAYRPSALAHSHDPDWQQSAEYDIPLPFGTKISSVFDDANGQLLILGEPGAGKTTMLLQLVSDLLRQAEEDPSRPIPAVFRLASWEHTQTLDEWLISELSNNYEVPGQLGRAWINGIGFIPLLDGLDEVEPGFRIPCADAINRFRQQYPGVKMLVTTRVSDYHALATRLQLDVAVVLQPLSMAQIDSYLSGHGRRLEGLRAMLRHDATMRELAQSPLMLSIMALAYNQMPADIAVSLGSQEKGRELLFDVYVDRMLHYRRGDKEFPPEDGVRWLSWLASMMERQKRTMFFLENIQPGWLPDAKQQEFVKRVKGTILLLFTGTGFFAGLLGVAAFGWVSILWGTILGLCIGLVQVISRRLLIKKKIVWEKIESVETLGWSWPWAWLGSITGGLVGLFSGLAISWVDNLMNDSLGVPWWLLLPVLLGAAVVLDRAVQQSAVKIRTAPGVGIERSRQNGLVVGAAAGAGTAIFSLIILGISAFFGASFSWLATLPWIFGAAASLGIASGLAYGGFAALQYSRLRELLEKSDIIPSEYIHFLDYASERSLLRKVGGGYTFMHALLMEYFAKRNHLNNRNTVFDNKNVRNFPSI
ncbi:MAG: NACHT domain-containing protein [Candidatus Promineifilaceae bacterium]|nr:NACHT domain-containing protein [Candidatus Promineifilaceae bacterium]